MEEEDGPHQLQQHGPPVVTAGQVKLHNGTPIAIDNSVKPSADANPHPLDHL